MNACTEARGNPPTPSFHGGQTDKTLPGLADRKGLTSPGQFRHRGYILD